MKPICQVRAWDWPIGFVGSVLSWPIAVSPNMKVLLVPSVTDAIETRVLSAMMAPLALEAKVV